MKVRYSVDGTQTLANALKNISKFTYEDVATKQIGQMYKRAQCGYSGGRTPSDGGSPVSTEKTRPNGPHGELKSSLRFEKDTMGWTKEYAPHVEYGHRSKSGGFIPGQHFLKNNVEKQKPIYKQDLIKALKNISRG